MIFFGNNYTIERFGNGYFDEAGEWHDGVITSISTIANIQFVDGIKNKIDPGGMFEIGDIIVFSDDSYNIALEETKQKADVIVFQNNKYEIMYKMSYHNFFNCFRYIAKLRKNDKQTDIDNL